MGSTIDEEYGGDSFNTKVPIFFYKDSTKYTNNGMLYLPYTDNIQGFQVVFEWGGN